MERKIPTPKEIFSYLGEYVIGQDNAKKSVATAAYHHLKRCSLPKQKRKLLKKSNILLIGPTGCGKTYLARKLADYLQIPFSIADATDYTQAGYHGKDVEMMMGELLLKAHHSIEDAQHGIIFIDEIDKIASRSSGSQLTGFRDIGGEGVQQALLKILEGREVLVPTSLTHQQTKQESVQIDTSDILFIAAGTFSGLQKQKLSRALGFIPTHDELLSRIGHHELLQYGLIFELLGRFPIKIQLSPLTESQLIEILVEPADSLVREYQYLFELDEVHIQFEEAALRTMAHLALQKGVGARGLRSLMEEVCKDLLFEAPDRKGEHIIITSHDVKERTMGSHSA